MVVGTDGADSGYLEISPLAAETVEAKRNLFCGENRLSPPTRQIGRRDDWFVLGGYAGAREGLTNEYLGSSLSTFTSKLTSCSNAPKELLNQPPNGLEVLDLWLASADEVAVLLLRRSLPGSRIPPPAAALSEAALVSIQACRKGTAFGVVHAFGYDHIRILRLLFPDVVEPREGMSSFARGVRLGRLQSLAHEAK